jgi:hypothetical protein
VLVLPYEVMRCALNRDEHLLVCYQVCEQVALQLFRGLGVQLP